jgi:hypothetical protein
VTTVELEIECGGEMHRIVVRSDQTVSLLDHNEKMLRAFSAFGAKRPECMEVVERFEEGENPLHFLFTTVNLPPPLLGKLACDFAERVLPIYEQQRLIPSDIRLRNSIITAFRFWDGEHVPYGSISAAADDALAVVFDLHDYTDDAYHSGTTIPDKRWRLRFAAAQYAANSVSSAINAALTFLNDGIENESETVRREHLVESVLDARGEAITAEWRWSLASDAAQEARIAAAWQLDHTLKAIKAWQKFQPWPQVTPAKVKP